jgi:hypothetical protein
MKSKISYVYMLTTESEETIESFKGQQEDQALKSRLKEFKERFYVSDVPDKKTAEDDFDRAWEEIKDFSRRRNVPGDVGTCVVRVEEAPAYRTTIGDSEDLVFHLENDDDIEVLLRNGLRDTEGPREGGPEWLVEAQLPAPLQGQDTFDFRAKVSAVKPLEAEGRFSFDHEIWLWDEAQERIAKGRILSCLCERGKMWSVSFRKTEKRAKPGGGSAAEPCYLNDPGEIKDLLWKTIFEVGPSEQHGLVVIAGRTGSCKSQIAKALIEAQMQGRPDKHLVTYEDPIERKIKTKGPITSREKGKDVSNLREATRNALRQKPAVLFVGETRDPEEWDMLLNYAGTGHLVVTTAHAGSLIEAMGNILQATNANDPAARSVVGERLLAVVHLKSDKTRADLGILIPALWRRTSEGIKALMSEGLSSLVPNTPPGLSDDRETQEPFPSSIGRYWFARELLEQEEAKRKLGDVREIENLALEWDLEGV